MALRFAYLYGLQTTTLKTMTQADYAFTAYVILKGARRSYFPIGLGSDLTRLIKFLAVTNASVRTERWCRFSVEYAIKVVERWTILTRSPSTWLQPASSGCTGGIYCVFGESAGTACIILIRILRQTPGASCGSVQSRQKFQSRSRRTYSLSKVDRVGCTVIVLSVCFANWLWKDYTRVIT